MKRPYFTQRVRKCLDRMAQTKLVRVHFCPFTFYSSACPSGKITSGIPSPTLQKNIAMGYVRNGSHKKGTEVVVEVRGKKRPAVITSMPFVQTRYWRGLDKAVKA